MLIFLQMERGDILVDKTKTSELFNDGYGVIPKAVMQDRNLSATAKLLYAYLSSFAGADNFCFPSKEKIMFDLGLSQGTISKYLKELVQHGLVSVSQKKEGGRFSHNLYSLNRAPYAKLPHTVETVTEPTVYGDLTATNNRNNKEHIYIKNRECIHPRDKPTKHHHGEFGHVLLTDDELSKLSADLGEPTVSEYIKRLDEYIEQKGAKYRNHSLTIRNWAKRDTERGQPKQPALQPEKTAEELYKVDFSKYRKD